MENKICCICNKEIVGEGHVPYGALDKKGDIIKWANEARCCKECNDNVVFPGRLKTIYNWDNNNENIKCKNH